MEKKWKTACPLNCYDVCGLMVTTKENRVIKIEGDKDHPITKGKICSKGLSIKDRIYDSNRILYPLKKVNGRFERLNWEQALDEISLKMKNIKQSYGPSAILHSYDYASGGLLKELDKRFFNYFGGMTETIGSLCWGAGIAAQGYDFGEALSHEPEDTLNANTIVIWGRNVPTTNMHLLPYINKARINGAKLVVINPVSSSLSKQADVHIPIQPGMDGLLALAISKIIIDNNWHDHFFINQYTIGFNEYRAQLDKIDLNKISKEINLSIDEINELAEVYSQQKPVMTFLGLGMQRYENGGNTIRAIDAIHAITGNIGIAGGGINYANQSVGRSFNWSALLGEDKRKEYRTFSRPSLAEEIIEANNPPIKLAFISRSNMVSQIPNVKRTVEAMKSIDTIVVMDMYMTETAKLADYILPIASVFEEEDIYYGSMFHNVMRYGTKLLDPPGEVWSDLKIWNELAKRLELNGFEKTKEEFFQIALSNLNKNRLTLEMLKEQKQLLLPVPSIPWQDFSFKTDSGKFEFYSEAALKDNLPPTAVLAYPKESIQKQPELKMKYPYNLLTIHPLKSLHSQHYTLRDEPKIVVYVSKQIAEKHELLDGDMIEIFNDRGKIEGSIKIKDNMNKETIYVEEGWWNKKGQSANLLTSNQLSDMGKGSIFYDNAVMISKIKLTS